MDRGDTDDTRQTADLEAPTAPVEPVRPPFESDRTEPDGAGPDRAGSGTAEEHAQQRRQPRLWFPLVVFVALLVAGALVGRYVVPATGPDVGAAPPTPAGKPVPTRDQVGPTSTPTALPLPTPPARPADALADWAGRISGAVDVPAVAVQAYGYAQLLLQSTDPECRLGWTTLAGIGEVESHHGQAGGAVLEPSGRSIPAIIGPPLDGAGGRPLVQDTDAGAYDGDPTHDRAMGPLSLMPSVWRAHASDADADQILDPYDIDDAALALARLLCAGSDDLGQLSGWTLAVGRYHTGDAYGRSVFQAADSYGQRTRDVG